MDNENALSISDLMLHAVEENPVSFKDSFDQLLMQRIEDNIEAAKTEVAQNYFQNQEQEVEADEESAEEQSDEQVEDDDGEDTETV